jgi:hypothetical protein
MTAKENALRIIRFDHPERVVTKIPGHSASYPVKREDAHDNHRFQ